MRILLIVFCLMLSSVCFSQIDTDRPNITSSPNVVPKGSFQIETGFAFQEDRQGYCGSNETYTDITVNSTQLRYGITDKVELRFSWTFNSNSILAESYPTLVACTKDFGNFPDTSISTSGLSPVYVGYKTNIFSNDRFSVGFLGHLYLPFTASEAYRPPHYGTEFIVPMTLKLEDHWAVSSQVSMLWDGSTSKTLSGYSVAFSRVVNDKFWAFVEPYGFIRENGPETHWVDAGFTYLVNNNFQLDLTAGVGISGTTANYIAAGACFLLGGKSFN